MWQVSHRTDSAVRPLADRHYNRQKIGSPQFAPPGRCFVLKTPAVDAFWITSWPFAEYVRHAWAGAWVCSAFRNEGAALSSELVRQAVAATRWFYGDAPALGMVTFVDPRKVKAKPHFGYCYRKAGFKEVGMTKGGLIALQLLPKEMPQEEMPVGAQERHATKTRRRPHGRGEASDVRVEKGVPIREPRYRDGGAARVERRPDQAQVVSVPDLQPVAPVAREEA